MELILLAALEGSMEFLTKWVVGKNLPKSSKINWLVRCLVAVSVPVDQYQLHSSERAAALPVPKGSVYWEETNPAVWAPTPWGRGL